jgi:hypothetical protein
MAKDRQGERQTGQKGRQGERQRGRRQTGTLEADRRKQKGRRQDKENDRQTGRKTEGKFALEKVFI